MAKEYAELVEENEELWQVKNELLTVARRLIIVCDDRLSILKEQEDFYKAIDCKEEDKDLNEQITHYTLLKEDAEKAVNKAEGKEWK